MDYRIMSTYQVVSVERKHGHQPLNTPASTEYTQAGCMWEHAADQVCHWLLALQKQCFR